MDNASSGVKLNIGCGTNKLAGWVNIDSVPEVKPDLVHDITEPLPFADQSVDEILADGILEHFDKYMRFLVFYEWVRVLKVGGKINIGVPDFQKTCFRYFKFGFNNFVDFIFGENLWNSKYYLGHFGNHKWGYSAKTLKEFVQIFGIEAVSVESKSLILRLAGVKRRHISWSDLQDVRIYANANKCGEGQPYVSLTDTRERIKIFQENLEQEKTVGSSQ